MLTIGISGHLSAAGRATFDVLGEALGVCFEPRAFEDDAGVDGWVIAGAGREQLSAVERARQPCYVALADGQSCEGGVSSTVRFADSSDITQILRGRVIMADDAIGARVLPRWIPDLVPLAFKGGSPVWGFRRCGGIRHHFVALAPPELNRGEPLFSVFGGRRIACMLPLIVFIRTLEERAGWHGPPLQATFMVDDPNLHWMSYGFLDYRDLIRHAVAGSYHVSIATIPLDAWFTHRSVGALFRQNPHGISLLIHGNDHVANELARPISPDAMQRVLRQALGRIARMESRTGLEVSRVMAPPHGACRETAMAEMARLGFEAICVSRGSLLFHNEGAPWLRAMGARPCERVAGLPVIPRFGLSKDCHNDLLVAALLRQPIVPMTHHEGVADGCQLLEEIASTVNSFGNVSWRNMTAISRSLYSHRQDGGVLSVRMWSRRICVRVPEETTHVRIEADVRGVSHDEPLFSIRTAAAPEWRGIPSSVAVPVDAGMTVEIADGVAAARPSITSARGHRIAAVARRVLTEGRDRTLPAIQQLIRQHQATNHNPSFSHPEEHS